MACRYQKLGGCKGSETKLVGTVSQSPSQLLAQMAENNSYIRSMGRTVYLPTYIYHKNQQNSWIGRYTIVPWESVMGMGNWNW